MWKSNNSVKNIIHLGRRPPNLWGPRLQPIEPIGQSDTDDTWHNVVDLVWVSFWRIGGRDGGGASSFFPGGPKILLAALSTVRNFCPTPLYWRAGKVRAIRLIAAAKLTDCTWSNLARLTYDNLKRENINTCLSSSCVLCNTCCQFLWVVHSWLPLRFLWRLVIVLSSNNFKYRKSVFLLEEFRLSLLQHSDIQLLIT